MTVRDPEICPKCGGSKFRVIDSRKRGSKRMRYRRRMQRCSDPACGQKWPAFLTTINPKHVYAV